MSAPRSPARRRALRLAARSSLALGVVLLAVALVAHVVGVRFNYTTSLPRGLYLTTAFDPAAAHRGELVAACPSEEAAEAVAEYLPRGSCPGGVIELAKRLAAVPGDTVVLDSSGVWVAGRLLPDSAPLFYDRRGRPLYPRLGRFDLGPGEYWLFSNRVRTSVDSRYVGPVSDVRSGLRPLLVED
ncbi:S26 family signal peptidase [Rubrivirga sp. S365]|uniref:S26 family signal peptidase n=1 Tax=Rubrivirga sp. S365 TaxID=3076080 RepID=UPI0028CAD2B8|nr:S26 family signal peptidase [Rubrivirga sp. S365]MDT7858209.1 S26 family signal peptidase [Rubrivirga sp. S365]